MLTTNPGSLGTLVFVVRRPGWPLVRGDARVIQSKIDAGDFEGFAVKAIVKETGVDDAGLNEFGTEYFPHSYFKDQALVYYNALGSGKISIPFNPLAMFRWIRDGMKRVKELDIKSHNTKGEGFLQGGWILFDPSGVPQVAFQENAKQRIPIDAILKEVQSMQSKSGNAEVGGEKKE